MTDNDDNIVEFTQAKLNRLRNLRPYKGKTDDEIKEILTNRKTPVPKQPKSKSSKDEYDVIFKSKIADLQKEYAVDMNNSNDVESLKTLVRQQIQLEQIQDDIDNIQRKDSRVPDDYSNLKKLGDFQRLTNLSIKEIQTELGISRKQRKEKAVDDIPKWIDNILERSKDFMEKKTTTIYCPKCKIELFRFWMNFKDAEGAITGQRLENDIQLSLQCWKCEEKVEHIQ